VSSKAKSSTALGYLFDLIGKVLVSLVKLLSKLLWRLVVVAVCHPRSTTALAVMSTLVLHFGWLAVTSAAGVLLLAASTWKAAHRRSFEATVQSWTRTWWRRWWAYRRRWVMVLTRCQLAVEDGDRVHLPKLLKVTTTPYWDRLTVRPQIGQEFRDYRDATERLRTAFGSARAVVREVTPQVYSLDFMRRDPLLETVPATPIPDSLAAVDLRRIPIGLDEFGDPYTVSLLGGTLCASGSIGAGKAGVEWNILRGIAPAIRAGLVRSIGIDPKLKELRQARPAIFADGDYATGPDDTVALLERVLADMQRDAERDGAQGERDFEPRPGRPLTVIYVDEGAPLTRYWPRSQRGKIDDLLGTILTQGRAVGYTVVFLIQEPTKDTFTLRDLFTRRIALRLPTESHTDAALIEDAVDYGAACHQISETTPGVLYSLEDGARSVVRARLGYVQNHHIAELVEYVSADRNVIDLNSRRETDTKAA
jgi:DNA segregation ATPase FtsK/SpoIIIE, S-DNA-T family